YFFHTYQEGRMATVIRNTHPAAAPMCAAHNDLKAQVGAGAHFHLDAYEHPIASATAADLATSVALVNEIRAVYNFHCSDALALPATAVEAGHAPAVAAHAPSADDPGLAGAIAPANDIKAKYNTHRASTSFHFNADSTNTITSADATDLASLETLANELKTD